MIIRRKSVIGALRFIVTMLSRHDMRARVSAMLTFAIYLEYVPNHLC